jgi:hypothetical protein
MKPSQNGSARDEPGKPRHRTTTHSLHVHLHATIVHCTYQNAFFISPSDLENLCQKG